MSASTSRGLVAFFLPHLGQGGVERSSFLLAEALIERGYSVEIVTTHDSRDEDLRYPVGSTQKFLRTNRVIIAVPMLARYLRREKPVGLISAQSYANIAAIWAKMLSRWKGRLIVTERLALRAAIDTSGNWKDRLNPWLIRRFYRRADARVANSNGAAESLREIGSLPGELVRVIYNPTNHPGIQQMADEPVDDPWFDEGQPPVIVTVGRLERQKDVFTLLSAFQQATQGGEERLFIIGDGSQRSELEQFANELDIDQRVKFAGFKSNPYPYVKRAHLFVLSSLYEGLPNVLIEALALGAPVVATDSPGGTSEILEGGRYGIMAEPGNAESLAAAIRQALGDYSRIQAMTEAARESLSRFTPEASVSAYMKLLDPAGPDS